MQKDGCGGMCRPSTEDVETGRSLGLRWRRLTYGAAATTPPAPLRDPGFTLAIGTLLRVTPPEIVSRPADFPDLPGQALS